jgi:hypothetical protein
MSCPACDAPLSTSLEWRLLRCRVCGALLVARRADDGGGPGCVYEVRGVRPRTMPRRVSVAWDAASAARLHLVLVGATVVTLALVLGLLAAAWLLL